MICSLYFFERIAPVFFSRDSSIEILTSDEEIEEEDALVLAWDSPLAATGSEGASKSDCVDDDVDVVDADESSNDCLVFASVATARRIFVF